MKRPDRLHLHEEIMLLALRDEEGTIFSGSRYNFAVGGAVLAELLMEKRIRVETVRKKRVASVLDAAALGDPLIDQCLSLIAEAKRPRELHDWIAKFADTPNLKHRAAERLVRRRILRVEEDRILGIFTRKTYPEVDPAPERELIERLRGAIFGDSQDVDLRTVVLLSLASRAGLLVSAFDRKAVRSRKARIAQVINGEVTGQATAEAIEAMVSALAVAAIIPAISS